MIIGIKKLDRLTFMWDVIFTVVDFVVGIPQLRADGRLEQTTLCYLLVFIGKFD